MSVLSMKEFTGMIKSIKNLIFIEIVDDYDANNENNVKEQLKIMLSSMKFMLILRNCL